MWYTGCSGEPWSENCQNRRKTVTTTGCVRMPMVRRQVTGLYVHLAPKPRAEEIAAVEPLYRALNDGSCKETYS